ncbi:cytoplasmic protein [Pseudescherichia vulneris]|uniref:cytoplasmic protein n=1 Tax=Pseudescherichia vulneris TaxID=566 RepID=UPI00227C14DC|nr:cytoplasmic protein [Pseudescherichia vulneris]WAH54116.1 cytoplasmic protein [Pseudescherichia vulneris]
MNKEIDNNNVYLTLDETKSDEFILKQNLDALIQNKNETIQRIAKESVSIPAALIRLKWQNRREIYALQVKEEIYGAAIDEIIALHPDLRDKIMAKLESHYQHILQREAATLRLNRKLADGEYRTGSVNRVALQEAQDNHTESSGSPAFPA